MKRKQLVQHFLYCQYLLVSQSKLDVTLFMGIADGYPHREAMWTVFLAENMLDDCETGQFYVSHCERYRGSLL